MTSDPSPLIHRFIRVEVADLDGFLAVHKKTREAHQVLGISEALYSRAIIPTTWHSSWPGLKRAYRA